MHTTHDEKVGGQNVVVLTDESADFSAGVAPGFGGACVSLRDGEDELLHGAYVFDRGPLKGRNPVLFPVVGRCFEKGELGLYRHRGVVYPMDIHGFVKDMPWREVDRQSDAERASVTCEITSDDETDKCYPYDFSLAITYAVEGRSLSIAAAIRNLSDDTMPFCFGYHPYFRAPIGDGRREDCAIRVAGQIIWEMAEGQPTGRRLDAPPEFATGLALPPDHLEKVLANIQRPPDADMSLCELECPDVGRIIRVEFDERALETVTVFSPPDSGFVCLEPRCGLPNALSDSAPVRDGVKDLPPGGEFRTTVRISVLSVQPAPQT